jgi:hypothetical protein
MREQKGEKKVTKVMVFCDYFLNYAASSSKTAECVNLSIRSTSSSVPLRKQPLSNKTKKDYVQCQNL